MCRAVLCVYRHYVAWLERLNHQQNILSYQEISTLSHTKP